MGAILPIAKSPWGVSLDAQRADLWQLDLAPAINRMLATLKENGVDEPWFDDILTNELKFMARTVSFPARQVTSNQVKVINATGNFPGYNQPSGAMTVTFIHDHKEDRDTNSLWLALDLWRAMVRAGQGPSFANQGSSQLDYTLAEASRPVGAANGLIPDYEHNLVVRLLRGAVVGDGFPMGAGGSSEYGLVTAAKYLVRQAWLMDYQLGELSYEGGTRLLEIKASFALNDYHLVTGDVIIGQIRSVP